MGKEGVGKWEKGWECGGWKQSGGEGRRKEELS